MVPILPNQGRLRRMRGRWVPNGGAVYLGIRGSILYGGGHGADKSCSRIGPLRECPWCSFAGGVDAVRSLMCCFHLSGITVTYDVSLQDWPPLTRALTVAMIAQWLRCSVSYSDQPSPRTHCVVLPTTSAHSLFAPLRPERGAAPVARCA